MASMDVRTDFPRLRDPGGGRALAFQQVGQAS
jgi:hypothetical protein